MDIPPGKVLMNQRERAKGPSRNKVYKYDAGILASGKAPARSISAGFVTSEQRSQRPKDQVRLERLFLDSP